MIVSPIRTIALGLLGPEGADFDPSGYTDLVDFTINQLRSTADSESRILYALACLYVAIKHPRKYYDGTGSRPKKLLSFGWIVATLALRELQKWSSD